MLSKLVKKKKKKGVLDNPEGTVGTVVDGSLVALRNSFERFESVMMKAVKEGQEGRTIGSFSASEVVHMIFGGRTEES